ncbi:UNVERIFIED_CONTAM: hypothetical protein Slati_3522100 [Sesamum latifolium]|uniref:Uncharacterized protein n=1 Tax=Sesamum latifolium TaxID=2727402 RepID=A0AAW2UJP4_9LAMI
MPRRSKGQPSGESSPSPATEVSSEAMALTSGTSSSMSEKAIKKIVDQMALPSDYEYVIPSPLDRVNNPPPGC